MCQCVYAFSFQNVIEKKYNNSGAVVFSPIAMDYDMDVRIINSRHISFILKNIYENYDIIRIYQDYNNYLF